MHLPWFKIGLLFESVDKEFPICKNLRIMIWEKLEDNNNPNFIMKGNEDIHMIGGDKSKDPVGKATEEI